MAETILLVDDNRLILESLGTLLKEEEAHLVTAGNSEEALAVVRGEEIAVVVSDNIMPGMSGLEFLSSLDALSGYRKNTHVGIRRSDHGTLRHQSQ